jgi:hypothetical protein
MKVKELEDKTLCLEGDILDGAKEAFNDSRYVEAFALLHAYIDWWMTDLIQLDKEIKTVRTEKLPHKYGFMDSLNCLKYKKIIDENEYERLRKFNGLRNLIIHRLVTRSYRNEPGTNRVTKTEVFEEFKEGEELAQIVRGKTGLVILGKFKPQVIEGRKNG